MKKVKLLLILILSLVVSQAFVLAEGQQRWRNLCEGGSANPYCVAVGKDAYNDDSHQVDLRVIKLGKITGVIWMKKGQIVSGTGESIRLAPKNAYYYIIDDQITEPFLRECSEIEVKSKKEYEGFSQR